MQKVYFTRSQVAEGVNEAKLTHRNPIGEWITEDSTHTHIESIIVVWFNIFMSAYRLLIMWKPNNARGMKKNNWQCV